MAKALKTAALVIGIGALAIVTGGAAVGLGLSLATTAFGVSASTLLLVSAGLSVGAALLTKAPTIPSSQTERLTASIDPRAFRKTVLGQTAMATDIRYEEWSGNDQEYLDWIVCVASHAIDGVEEIWIDQEMAWSATTGVTGRFAGYFSVPNIVLEGSPENAFTFESGLWNGSARLTGCAYLRLRFKTTGNGKKATSPFSSGISTRLTIIGRGAKLYDPRRDSTVPGGFGPMRWNDQSTWRYAADDGAVIGENLALQILRVVLGWRIRNPVTGELRLATGSGVPGRRLDMVAAQIAANLCDELVNRSAGGQEPRYHGAGVISEGDDPKTVLDMLCAACCGRFRDTGGKLALVIAHNDLAMAAADDGLNDDDVIGAFTWDPDASLEATPNVIRGRYVDATVASLYQLIDYPEVRIASADGQDRIATLDLGVVESPSQAQRVARQSLERRQYQRTFSAPFDIRAWRYGVGDVVPLTFAALSFDRALFRVQDQELGQGGSCVMTLTVEHQVIYAWDASDVAAVQAADPIVYDKGNNPLILAIDEAATTALWDGVTGGGKPADNADVTAEHTAADTAAVGGRPTGTVLSQIDQSIADIDALIAQVAGMDGGEAGAALLQAAEAARDAAIAAKANSETARDQSQVARDASNAARALAEQVAQAAAQSATSADGFATTASGQATIATQQADAAGQQATIATAKADIATTKAGEASVSSQSAAASESNAAGSSSSAATSAGVSASAKSATRAILDAQFPPVLDPVGRNSYESQFAYGIAGPDNSWPTPYIIGVTVPDANGLEFRHRAGIPRVAGRRYRLETHVFSYNTNARFAFAAHDYADPAFTNFRFLGEFGGASSSGGSTTVTPPYLAFFYLATEFVMDAAQQAFVRPFVWVLSTDGQPVANTIHIGGIRITDVTDSHAALGSAEASATSASSAAASEGAAGQHASAAESSGTAAQTAAGAAQTYRDQASTSATNASGSASTASAQATLSSQSAYQADQSRAGAQAAEVGAVGARDTAATHASASNTSAGFASTKADEAGANASAANQAKLDAQAANGSAQAQAGASQQQAVVATGAAAAAVESRDLAASYRDEAAGSASVASSSAAAADGHSATAQSAASLSAQYRNEAQVYRDGAAQQVVDAQALVSQEASARAGETGALATRIDTVKVTADGAAALVQVQSTAVADLQGRTAARFQVIADNGSGRGRLAVVADGFYGVDIEGDLRLSGNLLIDGTIQTLKVQDNAITAATSAVGSGTFATAWTTICAANYTAVGTGILEITVAGIMTIGASTPASGQNGRIRLLRDGSIEEIAPLTVAQNGAGATCFSFVTLTSGMAGAHSWSLQVSTAGGGNGSAAVDRATLIVKEFKK